MHPSRNSDSLCDNGRPPLAVIIAFLPFGAREALTETVKAWPARFPVSKKKRSIRIPIFRIAHTICGQLYTCTEDVSTLRKSRLYTPFRSSGSNLCGRYTRSSHDLHRQLSVDTFWTRITKPRVKTVSWVSHCPCSPVHTRRSTCPPDLQVPHCSLLQLGSFCPSPTSGTVKLVSSGIGQADPKSTISIRSIWWTSLPLFFLRYEVTQPANPCTFSATSSLPGSLVRTGYFECRSLCP